MTSSCVGKGRTWRLDLQGSPKAGRLAGALALGIALAAGPSVAMTAKDRALASVDSCIRAVFSQDAVAPLGRQVDLEQFCPDLALALRAGAIDAPRLEWAAETLSEDLSTGELLDLKVLVAGPSPGAELHWTQTRAQLSELLREVLLTDDSHGQLTWWDRFLEWLRDLVKTQGDTDLGWLEDILDSFRMSEDMANRVLYGVTALVFLSLIALVVYELRAAGFFRGHRKYIAQRDAPATTPSARLPKLSLSGIRALARQRQPAAVLRLCIQELIARGRLPDDGSRTNRELHRSLAQDQTAAGFGELVGLAENASYGGYPVTNQALTRCYASAEHILGAR